MRFVGAVVLLTGGCLALAGCGGSDDKPPDLPTVDAFHGRLTQDGKPVRFPQGEEVELQVFHEKGRKFGIPIEPDGTFKIGWMPIGKYSAMLTRPAKSKGPPLKHSVPGGFAIKEGQTEYTIELGKDYRP
jgi:hypothetical protein